MFTLEQCWIRSDNIFASFQLDEAWISALGQLYTVVCLIDCFSFGYGFATTSMITEYMLKGQIRRSKIVCVISIFCCLLISSIFILIVYFFKSELTVLLIPITGYTDPKKLEIAI